MPKNVLGETELAQYRTEGYLVIESIFGAGDLAAADAAIDELTQRALSGEDMSQVLELEPEAVDGHRVPRRIFHPFDQHDTFRKIATDPRVLDRIESLIGPNFNLHH